MLLLLIQTAWDDGRPATVTSLVDPLQTTQSSVTQLIAGAVRTGLVERVRDVHDGRRRYIHVTPEGFSRLGQACRQLGSDRARLTDALTSPSDE